MSATASSGDVAIDHNAVVAQVVKLLDKAGTDPRLTPRLLRNKTAEKLKLPVGSLEDLKPLIKKVIIKWWKTTQLQKEDEKKETVKVKAEEKPAGDASDDFGWKKLSKFAQVAGKAPAVYAGLSELAPKEKCDKLRERLREMGFNFSDIPTDAEISNERKAFERKRDAEDLDPSLIVNKKRTTGSQEPEDAQPSKKVEYTDEEAHF